MTEAVQPAPALPLRLHAVRWTASLHMTALVIQAALALGFLSGWADGYGHHRLNAWIVLGLGGVQALAALANGPSRTGVWLTVAAAALAALEGLQIYVGRAVLPGPHVLLGFVIWGLGIFFMVKVWMPAWAEKAR